MECANKGNIRGDRTNLHRENYTVGLILSYWLLESIGDIDSFLMNCNSWKIIHGNITIKSPIDPTLEYQAMVMNYNCLRQIKLYDLHKNDFA